MFRYFKNIWILFKLLNLFRCILLHISSCRCFYYISSTRENPSILCPLVGILSPFYVSILQEPFFLSCPLYRVYFTEKPVSRPCFSPSEKPASRPASYSAFRNFFSSNSLSYSKILILMTSFRLWVRNSAKIPSRIHSSIAKSVPRHIHYPSILKWQCLFRRVSEINAIFMNQTSLRLRVIFSLRQRADL